MKKISIIYKNSISFLISIDLIGSVRLCRTRPEHNIYIQFLAIPNLD